MQPRLATTPISWGFVGSGRWGVELPAERILSEMCALGFTATEAGVPGFLPDDVAEARALLERFAMEVVAGPVSFVIHEEGSAATALERVDAAAARLAALGASVLITVPKPGGHVPGDELPPDAWSQLARGLEAVEGLAADHGLRQAVHPHVGSLIETADDMTRLLEIADIGWCLDTAHLASGDMSTSRFMALAGDRVRHVHLKDLDIALGRRMVAHQVDFDDAIRAKVFRPLGAGDLDLADVVPHLPRDLCWVLEQDQPPPGEPDPGQGPSRDVERSLAALRELVALPL